MKLKNKTHKKKIKDSKSKTERRKKTRKRMKGGATAVRGRVAAARGMVEKVVTKALGKKRRRDHTISTITPPRKVGKKDASQKYIEYSQFSENESEHLLALYGRLDAVLRGFHSDSLEVNGINIYIKYKNGIVNNNKIIVMKTP